MRLFVIAAFLNEVNLKNVITFGMTTSNRKNRLNKRSLFLYFVLVVLKLVAKMIYILEKNNYDCTNIFNNKFNYQITIQITFLYS